MNRRHLLATLGTISCGGCLRLSNNDNSTTTQSVGEKTGTPTTTAPQTPDLDVTVVPPSEVPPGRPLNLSMSIENKAPTDFSGEILVLLNRKVQASKTIDIRAKTAKGLQFTVTPERLEPPELEIEVRKDDFREVLFAETIDIDTQRLTLDWQKVYIPAEDPDNPDDGENSIAFACQELIVEAEDETLASYNIGTDDEPTFLSGAYSRVDDDTWGTFRWLGTEEKTTIIAFDDVDLANASTVRMIGEVPPTEIGLEVQIGELVTDTLTLNRRDEYLLSVDPY